MIPYSTVGALNVYVSTVDGLDQDTSQEPHGPGRDAPQRQWGAISTHGARGRREPESRLSDRKLSQAT